MRISNVRLKNFRCVRDVSAPLDNLTAFVGRNGSGKSSVLQAINVFFTLNARISREDFFNKVTTEPIEIELTFEDFTPEEYKDLNSYIHNEKLVVVKKISYDEEQCAAVEEYFSYAQQIPQFADIRKIAGARNKTDALKELKNSLFSDIESPRSETHALEIMEKYETTHPELLKLIQVKGNFFGARNVGGGKIDNYTKLIFLPAVKEATEETEEKSGSIAKLLDMVVLQEIENREDLLRFREEITQRIQQKYSPENLGGLDEISEAISDTLGRYAPGSKLSLLWNEVEMPEISLPTVSTTVFEDDFGGSISKKGHGLQRALILTLLEHLALTLSPSQVTSSEDGKSEATANVPKPLRIDTILLIEEPEIYLHPTRARYLSKILLELANTGLRKSSNSRAQVIYTTHSPYFVGLDRFDNVRLCRKIKRAAEVPDTNVVWNTLISAGSRYESVCARGVHCANPRENFRVRSANVMNTLINEGFFADLVVLVEGPSDCGVLWKVQELLGKNWDKYAISVIPAENKENIIRIKIIFDGLGIPNFVVFDKDEQNQRSNQRLMRLVGQNPPDLPAEKIHDTWAYNENNLEDELQRDLSAEKCTEIWDFIKNELDYRSDRIKKSAEATAWFTEIAYARNLKFAHFESIVNKISDLFVSVVK